MDYSNNILSVGKKLRGGTITIIGHISSGGFGNTYIVRNNFDEVLAMKEFFMKDINQRERDLVTVSVAANRKTYDSQREKFAKEAKRLRKLNNEHVVHVHDLFDENNTSYYVMDYIEGESLASRLKRTNKPLPQSDVIDIFKQLLEALTYIHSQGIWHLDIKPANIMVNKSGKVVLVDFGASKQMDSKGSYTATSTMLCYSPHFAPLEQIEQNLAKIGPWTDFYSLGATLYNLLTNTMPPSSSDISAEGKDAFVFNEDVTTDVQQFIIMLMRPSWKERPQDIDGVHYLLGLIAERNKLGNIGNNGKNLGTVNTPKPYNESIEKKSFSQSSATQNNESNDKTFYGGNDRNFHVRINSEEFDPEQTSFDGNKGLPTLLTPAVEKRMKEWIQSKKGREIVRRIINNMVYVEGGSFEMGNIEYEKLNRWQRWKSSGEYKHKVVLSSFFISKYVITKEDEYYISHYGFPDKKIDDYIYTYDWLKRKKLPCVSWLKGGRFRLTDLKCITGLPFRLPTEAEWEYAARGGRYSKGYLYSGSNNLDEVGWYLGNNSKAKYGIFATGEPFMSVGQKKPNELGLYDMSGGVYELCQDHYANYPHIEQVNPVNKKQEGVSGFIMRGGSFKSKPFRCTVHYRSLARAEPDPVPIKDYAAADNELGIRLVIGVDDLLKRRRT